MRTDLAVSLFLVVAVTAHAPPFERSPPVGPDAQAIQQAALDYIEGWYEGNPERMGRAVHPELQKRIVITEAGVSRIENMGASKLVASVRAGVGKKTPAAAQKKDVTILDRFENAASVKVVATDWVNYLHLARVDGRWVIVNVLWELHPKK
jgi:hypothetical protein